MISCNREYKINTKIFGSSRKIKNKVKQIRFFTKLRESLIILLLIALLVLTEKMA